MMNLIYKCLLIALTTISLLPTAAQANLKTVPYVDVSRYLGTWYQISRNPLMFEDGCVCSRQVLDVRPDGNVGVYNSCNAETVNGRLKEIRGFAVNVDPASNSKFKVDFYLPHKGDYWIIGLDEEYRYAVVSDPSMKSLYILSKTPTLDQALYEQAVAEAATQIDTSKLLMTVQQGCTYP